MSRDIIQQLKNLKQGEVSPREEWLKNNREILLSQIKNTIPSETKPGAVEKIWLGMSIFLPKKVVFDFVRPLSILLVVAIVGTSGWIATVDASYQSLPGDLLYPAKRAVEKTQVIAANVTGNKKAATKLHSEFAKRRAAELKQVVKDPKKQNKAIQAVVDLKKEIKNVNNSLEEIKNNTADKGQAETAKDISKSVEQIKITLKEVKDDLSSGTSTESKILSKDVSEVKDMAKDTAVNAVEVLVTKHLEGDTTVTKEEVIAVLDKTIQTTVTEIAAGQQNMVGVNTVVTAVKEAVKTENLTMNTTSTPAEQQLLDKVTDQTKVATVKTQEASVVLDKTVSEAKTLLASDNLSQVVDKIREAAETSKTVEKMQDNVLSSAARVLPAPVIEAVKTAVGDSLSPSSTESWKIIVVSTTPQGGAATTLNNLPIAVIVTSTPAVTSTKK